MTDSTAADIATPPPLVSVIIPCFNGEAFVSDAIASAMAQTHGAIEVIFVDDGSSDGSLAAARRFPQMTIISQSNAGVSAARNAGLAVARGDFVLFLDADDRLHPNAVRLHLAAFSGSDAMPMVYGSNRIIDAQDGVIGHNPQIARRFGWRDVLMGVTPTPSQSMFRRDAVMTAGGFDPSVKLGEDFDLYLRVTSTGESYCHGEIVADYRRHALQATKQPSSSLVSILGVIDRFMRGSAAPLQGDEIWRRARRHWRIYYGQYIPFEVAKCAVKRDWKRSANALSTYLAHLPYTAAGSILYLARRIGQSTAS